MTPLDQRFSRVSAEIAEGAVGLGSRLVEHPIVLCLAGGLTPQAVLVAPAYFAGELHGVTGSEAFLAGMGDLRWGVGMARQGWLSPTDVLNTLGPDDFRAAVRP